MPSAPPIHLLDGGLGTTLTDLYAQSFDTSTPLWSSHLLLTSPSTLLASQSAFAAAGADVVLTATYQASYEGFALTGRGVEEEEAARCMRNAVGIARESFKGRGAEAGEENGKGKVALSLGAYGATMVPSQEYSGKYDAEHLSVDGLREWHLRRIQTFFPTGSGSGEKAEVERKECWANVDLVAFETLPLLAEITAVRRVMYNVEELNEGTEKQFWISCVFPGERNCLPDGSSVREVVGAILGKTEGARKPMGVGINCTKAGKVEGLILEFEKAVGEVLGKENEKQEWPSLVVYPDGTDGEVYNTSTKQWEKSEKDDLSSMPWDKKVFGIVQQARERGLWRSIYVGGCCKTTPSDIGKLRKRIDEQS